MHASIKSEIPGYPLGPPPCTRRSELSSSILASRRYPAPVAKATMRLPSVNDITRDKYVMVVDRRRRSRSAQRNRESMLARP